MSGAWITAALLPPVLCAAIIAWLRRSRLTHVLQDRPNERSLHDEPRPRVGGIGLVAAAVCVGWALAGRETALPLALAAGLAVVSLADDRRSLPIAVRLAAHMAAALAVAFTCLPVQWPVALVAALAIAWMTNLYNFMDGADGLAGGMGLIGFATLAAGAAMANDMPLAWTCTCIASACAGFLLHNFPPARVFLGDAGSIPLGFLAGALGVLGAARHAWPAWFPALAFAPFIVDASVTLLRRAVRREKFWRAHRTHAYQRLVLAGWTHRRLALSAYAVMCLSSFCAVLALRAGAPGRSVIIGIWIAALALAFLALERRLARAAVPPCPGPDR
ncbi:MAG TPA: glycosyltransferase family 4 protein [Usitatibacter sp.]|jgi:UDP-N-acetylmuramyl pentapeptide phosphotransferase/UDP-N-acetylglucosamine-1-phosphate transferase|nr:glycosyltransferase family 4 protein [Usitatibacter sp.]